MIHRRNACEKKKDRAKFGQLNDITYLCNRKYGKVLYGMLPRNPPGFDRSKGTWL